MAKKQKKTSKKEATQTAIDWALSCANDMFDIVGGDAEALTGLAVEAVEGINADGKDEDLEFDEEAITSAIEEVFAEMA